METELWPNMLASCQNNKIPVVLANARMSPRSAHRYGLFPLLSPWIFSKITKVLAQYPSDAQHFITLGVANTKVSVTGSVKFDFEAEPNALLQGQQLRQGLGIYRPIVIAASTRDDEEQLVLEAFQALLKNKPNSLLILVPRHPQRFEQVYQLCIATGFSVAKRSATQSISEEIQIYLGDTMGELPQLYAASDLAFIGGSLVPLGGQNMLEPAAIGKPCLMGPSLFNFRDISKELIKREGLKICEDQHELAHCFNRLLEDDELRVKMGNKARQTVSDNRGAVDKTLNLLRPFLKEHEVN